MKTSRKKHSAAFKAQVAIEAIAYSGAKPPTFPTLK